VPGSASTQSGEAVAVQYVVKFDLQVLSAALLNTKVERRPTLRSGTFYLPAIARKPPSRAWLLLP
jgi:hypothetical protein